MRMRLTRNLADWAGSNDGAVRGVEQEGEADDAAGADVHTDLLRDEAVSDSKVRSCVYWEIVLRG